MFAITLGHVAVVDALIDAGASTSHKDAVRSPANIRLQIWYIILQRISACKLFTDELFSKRAILSSQNVSVREESSRSSVVRTCRAGACAGARAPAAPAGRRQGRRERGTRSG